MIRSDRCYCRYLAQGHAYAALRKNYDRVGKIIDISLGGLAFEYLCNEQYISEGLTSINIFITDDGFHLPDITCRIICDHPKHCTTIENASSLIKKNTCSVQFIALSEFQMERLDFFIKNYTTGPAP